MSESAIVGFYRGTGTDHAGRHLHDILAWDDESLEAIHDYIQWMFPSDEPSRANPFAPLLTTEDEAAFRGDATLQSTLRRALDRILRFYGLERDTSGGRLTVRPSALWHSRAANWLQPYNHNHLRLTRIMKCLRLLGLEAEGQALQERLLDIAERSHPLAVSRTTLGYWKRALD